jgi:D-lyxose ketol-isomerase
METMLDAYHISLPPFCRWSPEQWKTKNHEYDEIRDNRLGWDITDFGYEDFDRTGFALITLRNGNQKDPKYRKVYAEKLIMLKDGQTAPLHYHWFKSEDIINRGGGNLLITVYNGDEARNKLDNDVMVNSDGRSYIVKAGTAVRLCPGESITLWPYQYHSFAIEKGSGDVMIGEVSRCNDDETDNCFFEDIPRFPSIIEDEAPYRLLCTEYPEVER